METWHKPEAFAIGLGIVFIIFLALIAFIVVFMRLYFKRLIYEQNEQKRINDQHQKALLEKSIITQERERKRIASELHDGLISKLNTIIYMLSAGNRENIKAAAEQLSESIQLARKISHDLTPPLIEETGPAELLSEFLYPLQKSFTVELNALNSPRIHVEPTCKLQVYRIFQEAISNIIKHANATQIIVDLRITGKYIALKVQDNGVGFDREALEPGLGLNNMIIRTQFLNGTYKLKSKKHKGTTLIFGFKIK